jgi:hypothetical protein
MKKKKRKILYFWPDWRRSPESGCTNSGQGARVDCPVALQGGYRSGQPDGIIPNADIAVSDQEIGVPVKRFGDDDLRSTGT